MLKKMWDSIVRLQEKRAAYWMLYSMSDSQLKDVGITRGDIRRVLNGGGI